MAFRVSRRKVNPNEVEINEAENQKICQQIWREWNGQVEVYLVLFTTWGKLISSSTNKTF